MNTRSLTSWLLILGPIGMFLIWFILDPIVIGEVPEGLSPSEEAIAGLQLDLDQQALSNVMNMIGGFAFIGILIMLKGSLDNIGFLGNIFALFCAGCFSCFIIIVRKYNHIDMTNNDIRGSLVTI